MRKGEHGDARCHKHALAATRILDAIAQTRTSDNHSTEARTACKAVHRDTTRLGDYVDSRCFCGTIGQGFPPLHRVLGP